MWHLAGMGLLVSLGAPALIAGTRRFVPWHRVWAPPLLTLPGFVVLHGAITVAMAHTAPATAAATATHGVLLLGAVVFWLPVVVPGGRSEATRCVYLFLAGPALDLAAVYLVITGDEAGGLSMIVGMLPIGLAAVALTWRWLTREERERLAAASGGR